MARIFISHSTHDNARAIAIRDWLDAEGWNDLFLDLDPERGIAAGDRWEQALYAATNRCEAVLFLVSRAWLSSTWCLRELNLAHRLNKRLFGVLIENLPEADIPAELSQTWQLVQLDAGTDHLLFPVTMPITGTRTTVTFSREGLARLRLGLQRAGLDASYFAWPPASDPGRPPFRGLRPMEPEDAGIFFGREAATIEALDRLRGLSELPPPRVFVILGASGSGKSSFLRAGLYPRLARDDRSYLPLPIIRPAHAALYGESGLLHALEAACAAAGQRVSRAQLRDAIEAGAASIGPLLQALAVEATPAALGVEAKPRPPALILSIDQAEELFLTEGLEEAHRFLNLLRDLALGSEPSIIVVLTIRSDNYERLQLAKELEGIGHSTFSLTPMLRGSFADVIRGPARRLEGSDRALSIDDNLVEALLADMEAGAAKDTLPLLAFTLERLYLEYHAEGKLKLEHYERLGGVTGSINAAVDQAFKAAARDARIPQDRDARLAMLRRGLIPWLAGIDPDTGAPRRRVARLSEIPAEARPLVDLLVEQRLLSTDIAAETKEFTIEPAHEALLRQWGLLQGWLAEDAGLLSVLDGLKRASRDWSANARASAWLVHADDRLRATDRLMVRADLSDHLEPTDLAYLTSCHAFERARFRRRTGWAVTLGALLLGAVVGLAGIYIQWRSTQIGQSQFLSELAARQIADGDSATAMLVALEGLPDQKSESLYQRLRPFVPEVQHAADLAARSRREVKVLGGHTQRVRVASYSPDGSRIVTASFDGTARIWNAVSGAQVHTLSGHSAKVTTAEFSPDGRLVATASGDKTARIWDAETGALLRTLEGHTDDVLSARWSPDGTRLVTASDDHTARLWEVATGNIVAVLSGHAKEVNSAVFSPDGRRIATGSMDTSVRLWDGTTGAGISVLDGHDRPVWFANFDSDGRRIVSGSDDKIAIIWDANTGRPITFLKGHDVRVGYAEFSSDGHRVLTASFDSTARVWNAATGGTIAVLSGHKAAVVTARFSPDGHQIVTASFDGTARLWNADSGKSAAVYAGHGGEVTSATFSLDQRNVLTAAGDGTARVWDALEIRNVPLLGHRGTVWRATYAPDDSLLATAGFDATVRIWVAETGTPTAVLSGHNSEVMAIAFSPDGRRLYTASKDATAKVWDTAGQDLLTFTGHTGEIVDLAVSGTGRHIATASFDRTARIWDAASGRVLATLTGHADKVVTLDFSPDGLLLATGSHDATVRLWEVGTGRLISTLAGHEKEINTVKFSPDGRLLVSASDDKTARLWDSASGRQVAILIGHEKEVASAEFSPDGRHVLTASWDTRARLWDVTTGMTVHVLQGHDRELNGGVFSPNSRRLATFSDDGSARVYDVASGKLLATLIASGKVNTARFSMSGRQIATGTDNGTGLISPLFETAQEIVDHIIRNAPRCLTQLQRRSYHLPDQAPSWCVLARKWPYSQGP